jgi:hypothetical protein
MGQAGDGDAAVHQPVGEVIGGALPLNGGVDGQDHFAHIWRGSTLDKLLDREVIRPDAIKRREHAAQHMVAAAARLGALQRPKVGDILHHHQHGILAARVGAHRAGADSVDIAAAFALHDIVARDRHRLGQRPEKLVFAFDKVQGRTAGRTRAESGELGEQLGSVARSPGRRYGHS